MTIFIIKSVMLLFSGLGAFLFGIRCFSDTLFERFSKALNKLFYRSKDNPIGNTLIGAGCSFVLQSSSITTTLTVALADKKAVNLFQAAFIIAGANVGTTSLAFLFTLSNLPILEFFCLLTLLSPLLAILKKPNFVYLSRALTYIGIAFLGLYVMSSQAKAIASISAFQKLLLNNDNLFFAFLYGALFTSIIQSSNATIGLCIVGLSSNMLTLINSLFIILGANIGTCITAILSAIGKNRNAKYVALFHLFFNLLSALIFLPIAYALYRTNSLSTFLRGSPPLQAAVFNFYINTATTVLIIPFGYVFLYIKKKEKPRLLLNKAN